MIPSDQGVRGNPQLMRDLLRFAEERGQTPKALIIDIVENWVAEQRLEAIRTHAVPLAGFSGSRYPPTYSFDELISFLLRVV